MHEAEVIVDEQVPMVTIIRDFDAPAAKVFRAHVEPELFVRWNWPPGFDVQFDQWDCRTGGAYRITMAGDGMAGTVHGSFHDVLPNELIVQTFAADGMGDVVILEKHRFEDLGGGRSRLTAISLVDRFEYRDSFVDAGLVENFAKLDELLTTL